MRSNLESCVFDNTVLSSRFVKCNFTRAQMNKCDIIGSVFMGCDLTDINLTDARLIKVVFQNCVANGKPITDDWLRKRGVSYAEQVSISYVPKEPQQASFFFHPHRKIDNEIELGCDVPPNSFMDEKGRTVVF